jgi:hypothetical protein
MINCKIFTIVLFFCNYKWQKTGQFDQKNYLEDFENRHQKSVGDIYILDMGYIYGT